MKLKKWFKTFAFSEFSTGRKSLNFLLATLQWRLLKNAKVFTYPIQLTVCPGTVCNLRCVLCPVGQNDGNRQKGLMTFDTFKKVMNECGPYVYVLDLYNWGEPFLNQDIFNMVRFSKRFKIKVIISTNLKYFDDTICSELIKSEVDLVIVSLHGASQTSVNKYQVGNNFGEIITNMEKLIEFKKQLKSEKPALHWRFLVNKFNESEIDEARVLSKQIGVDRLEIRGFRCDMGTELLLNTKEQFKSVEQWLPKEESLSKYHYSKKEKKRILTDDCSWLWLKSSINWNGSVAPCCGVWHEKFDFGNVRESSFHKIWNSSKYQEARKIVRGDSLRSSENVCSICHSNRAAI